MAHFLVEGPYTPFDVIQKRHVDRDTKWLGQLPLRNIVVHCTLKSVVGGSRGRTEKILRNELHRKRSIGERSGKERDLRINNSMPHTINWKDWQLYRATFLTHDETMKSSYKGRNICLRKYVTCARLAS